MPDNHKSNIEKIKLELFQHHINNYIDIISMSAPLNVYEKLSSIDVDTIITRIIESEN